MARFGRRIPIQHQFNPKIAPFEPVTVDVFGASGSSGLQVYGTNNSFSQTIYGNRLYLAVNVYTQNPYYPYSGGPLYLGVSATVGGKSMSVANFIYDYVSNPPGQSYSSAWLFSMNNPPQGNQTFSIAASSNTYMIVNWNAISFRNVGSVGPVQSSNGSSSIAQNVTGLASNGLILTALFGSISGFNGTTLVNASSILLGTSTSGTVSATSSGLAWAAISVPLNPLPFPPALPELYNQVPVTMSRGSAY